MTFRSETVPLHRVGLGGNLLLLATVIRYARARARARVAALCVAPLRDALGGRAFAAPELLIMIALALPSRLVPGLLKTVRPDALSTDGWRGAPACRRLTRRRR
ncbi:MAG: hypothetical protein O3B31_04290 [Chloroflexi bacterium]|nr:hypothetical protein [Chloroflexota bacterium]MDA1002558.1 hypothetical protein [Chloroflexota bacterium]